ncbi:MAG: biotin/lipoyl-containing protein [Pseudomonadales bacterium]
MSQEILLPKIDFSMTKAKFVEWLVDDGADVEEGELLYAIENEKAVEEVPAPGSGKLKQVAQPDEEYEVGKVLGYLE